MKMIHAYDVLRYLKRHLEWLAKEGADTESLDADTCAQFSKMMGDEAEAVALDEGFTFDIDQVKK